MMNIRKKEKIEEEAPQNKKSNFRALALRAKNY